MNLLRFFLPPGLRRKLGHTALGVALAAMAVAAMATDDANTAIQRAIVAFLEKHAQTLPGQASFSIGSIKVGQNLAECLRWEVSMTPGARAMGRTHVQVRCGGDSRWSSFVPVQITVLGPYLVSARAIQAGQSLAEADVAVKQGDISQLPHGVLDKPAQVAGKASGVTLAPGQILRADMLRQPPVVQQGQHVRLTTSGTGFEISNEGIALNAATSGQPVRVKLANGQTIGGIARADGAVEIKF